jgi:hypothetical protein
MPPRSAAQVRLGNTHAQAPSPLPQSYPATEQPYPTQVVNGFTSWLPGRTRIFFQRIYFLKYPRPIQMALGAPYPTDRTIFKLRAPQEQVIVFKDVSFKVYIHSGIGNDDVVQISPTRTTTFLGFSFSQGNRGITDYNTNVSAIAGAVSAGPNGTTVAPQSGGGSIWPFAGSIVPQDDLYAGYIMPNQEFDAKVVLLREPNFDFRIVSCSISGWLVGETQFNAMIDKLTG